MYQEVPIDTFSGLDLADDPEEAGLDRAVDLLNVDVTSRGRLRTRRGTSTFAAGAATTDYAKDVSYFSGQILAGWIAASGDYLKAYDSSGATLYTMAGRTLFGRFAAIGAPSATVVYFATDAGLARYTAGAGFALAGTTFASLSGVAAHPTEKRIVVAGSTTASTESRVSFSGAGTFEVFAANDYVELDPGDGEAITSIVTWRDQIFVFKRTKFFIFYGSSVTSTGTTIFNYRPERTGTGAITATAARDGVYFLSPDGLYRTTGDLPVKVSAAIDPYFTGDPAATGGSLPTLTYATLALSADHRFVYLQQGTSRTFLLDTETGQWTIYDLGITAAATDPLSNDVIVGVRGKLAKLAASLTTDSGTPIPWSYTTGFSDLGSTAEKLVKQVQVWGTGTVTASVYTDHGTTDAGAGTLTLGATPAVARDQQFYSRKGTFFGLGLSGAGPAIINRVALGVAERRLTGVT